MFTIAVCDDNKPFADLLTDRLRTLCAYHLAEQIPCHVLTPFYAADEVLSYVEGHSVQVLFLDIDMPKFSGFELAKELERRSGETVIVFVSSYDQLVYDSFEYSPFRFLRKNHLDEELAPTFRKVIEKYLYDRETIQVQTIDGEVVLRIADVVSIESDKNYFLVHTVGNTYRCRGTMQEAERQTAPYDFVRIHSAMIVNLAQIDTVGSDGMIRLRDGSIAYVSRRKLPTFRDAYLKYTRRRFIR